MSVDDISFLDELDAVLSNRPRISTSNDPWDSPKPVVPVTSAISQHKLSEMQSNARKRREFKHDEEFEAFLEDDNLGKSPAQKFQELRRRSEELDRLKTQMTEDMEVTEHEESWNEEGLEYSTSYDDSILLLQSQSVDHSREFITSSKNVKDFQDNQEEKEYDETNSFISEDSDIGDASISWSEHSQTKSLEQDKFNDHFLTESYHDSFSASASGYINESYSASFDNSAVSVIKEEIPHESVSEIISEHSAHDSIFYSSRDSVSVDYSSGDSKMGLITKALSNELINRDIDDASDVNSNESISESNKSFAYSEDEISRLSQDVIIGGSTKNNLRDNNLSLLEGSYNLSFDRIDVPLRETLEISQVISAPIDKVKEPEKMPSLPPNNLLLPTNISIPVAGLPSFVTNNICSNETYPVGVLYLVPFDSKESISKVNESTKTQISKVLVDKGTEPIDWTDEPDIVSKPEVSKQNLNFNPYLSHYTPSLYLSQIKSILLNLNSASHKSKLVKPIEKSRKTNFEDVLMKLKMQRPQKLSFEDALKIVDMMD